MSRRVSEDVVHFAAINAACLANFTSLLAAWLPDGQLRGREWVARNPTRDDNQPGSFSVNTRSGRWADFATDDRGGDPVSLYAFLNDLSQSRAARELRDDWGIGR